MSDYTRHHRRRSTQAPISGSQQIHNRLPRLFSGHGPAAIKNEDDSAPEEEPLSSDEDEECLQRQSTLSSFLASAARTYSRAMYAHTTSQIARPGTSTLPSYNRTMHAFTLNQLNHMDNTGSHNPDSLRKHSSGQQSIARGPNSMHKSHISAAPPLALKLPPAQNGSQDPTRSLAALKQMSLDEEPCGPSNTPEPAGAALAPAPTSAPSLSSAELLSQGRELEAKFNGSMSGVSGESVVGGLRSEARDFAAVGLVDFRDAL
ncbi:hypothetical protein MBLNU13_g07164t1 [Cladosporium sp. NU13]